MLISNKLNSILVLLLLSVGLFFYFGNIEAYETGSTHPFLTKQIANLYNQIYTPKLTDEEIRQMVEGSVDEDTTPRWVNHFYDPTTGDGLLGKRLGDLPSEDIVTVIKIVFNEIPGSTLDWVHNQELQQNSYALFEGNRTFESAALSYVDNKNNEAYYNLGYVLHNIEDMAVPAHTRQDSHFDMPVPEVIQNLLQVKLDKGEPYEKWAESYTRYNPTDLVEELKKDYIPICNSLDDCLKVVANYSNGNFFSSDTLLDEEYESPEVSSYKVEGDYINAYSNDGILLFKTSRGDQQENIIGFDDINQAYWNKLAPKAVLAGVEVVRYFKDQAEKAKKGEITIDRVSETIDPIADFNNFSPYGWLTKTYNDGKLAVTNFWNTLKNFGSDFTSRLTETINGFGAGSVINSVISDYTVQESTDESDFPLSSPDTTIVLEQDDPDENEPNPDIITDKERQEMLDDIIEQLDIINRQIQDLMEEEQKQQNNVQDDKDDEIQQNDQDNDQEQRNPVDIKDPSISGSDGSSSTNYSKILISEVQTAGKTDAKEEFVELYNPNDIEVDLTNWYLQKKTSSGSVSYFDKKTLFIGRKISAKSYFLIAREGYFAGYEKISVGAALSDDSSLILNNPNNEVSDKVGWGSAQDYELLATQNPEAGQSIGRKVLSDGTEEETDNNLNDFELQTPTPKAKNITYIAGGKGDEKTDKTAPQVSFSVNSTQTDLNFTVDFTITDSLVGTVSPSGIDSYVFRWQEDGGVWREDLRQQVSGSPTFVNLTRDFAYQDEETYYFQVKAKDIAGNESDWQPETPASTTINIPKMVLINEIQTEGATVKDEFIELYNPNNVDVDLSGFSLKKKTVGGTESNLVSSSNFLGKILAKGYFLIVPKNNDDGSVNYKGSATPDLYYSGKTYSIASDNTILLYNSSETLLDKVGFGKASDFETAAVVNPDTLKSIERKIIGKDTNDNSADFRVSDNPTPGASFMQSNIEDATNYIDNFGDYSGARYYNLTLKWNSKSPNLDFYQLQYKKNNGEWKDWLQNTIETQKDFIAYYSTLSDENIYYFRVRPQDKDGNQGDWQQTDIDLSSSVVINEVALYGTNSNKDDQWLELYNKTNKEVDLTGWKIVCDGLSIDLQGKISPKSYLLLENDVLLSHLSGNNLRLLDAKQRYVDIFYTPSGGWSESHFIIDGKTYSLERISPYSLGSEAHNWKKNNGTPNQQNSNYQLYTFLPPGFGTDELLKKSLSPFVVSENSRIFKEAILTIEPGSVIKFYSTTSKLLVDGTVKAIGNDTEKIVFTSFLDDDCGTIPVCGDTNGDAGASNSVAGSWSGVQFSKDSSNSEFDYAAFYYGGFNSEAAVKVEQSSISIRNSVFDKNLNRGLYLINSSSTVDSTEFLKQNTADVGSIINPTGIHILGGSPHITDSHFKDNYYGIIVDNWSDDAGNIITTGVYVENNVFENNLGSAVYLITLDHPYFSGNTASGNGFNSILIIADKIPGNITLQPDTIPYLVRNILTVPAGMTLTLQPGVIIDFQSNWSGIQIEGTLKAIDTSGSNPIVFRHYRHDLEGVGPGSWLGLQFSGTSKDSELENIDVSLGGAFYPGGSNFGAAIKVDQSSILLKNSVIQKNLNNGLWLINSSSVVDSVRFIDNNTIKGVEDNALFVEGGSPQVTNIIIEGSY